MSFKPLATAALLGALVLAPGIAGAQTAAPAPAAPAAAAPLPPPAPFEEALLKAATDLLTKAAALPESYGEKLDIVIDPLIDGVSGMQSVATRSMEKRLIDIAMKNYTRFNVQPFTTASVAKSPVVLIGTFTPINAGGQAGGIKDAYRICLALADLKSKTIVSKGFARAQPAGIDTTPTAAFDDSPIWTTDPATEAYVKSCQGTKAGDPINQAYSDRIMASALLSDAINAYNAKKYKDSLELYTTALATPGGDQLRAHNGIYLSNWKLGRKEQAANAFGQVIDFGLSRQKLSLRFLFKPGSTAFVADKRLTAAYPMWVKQVATRAAKQSTCMEIVGHTSPTGPEPINMRLSTLRAEAVKDQLVRDVPDLGKRVIANGVGSKENLIGTGKDNPSDALDRRVEFKVLGGC